jgi:Family of unknown function (DUF6314)
MTSSASKKLAPPQHVFAGLEGAWNIRRVIEDKMNGSAPLFEGTASFVAGPAGYAYNETGVLRMDADKTFDATRSYIYMPEADGFSVWFPEEPPRLFHAIRLYADGDMQFGAASHRCGNDVYDSDYAFYGDGSFTVRHAVTGPRKSYIMTSTYTRNAA